ncbi:hypothetical protein AX16_000380 [Volvariella volvacea WC 439]|nr:hypothetical protein AX16_000380 [Volvariella volvacea WC 439]
MSPLGPSLRCFMPANPDIPDDDSDVCSVASMAPFSPSLSAAATSETSHDFSMRSASPAPSVWSMTPSLIAASYKEEFGRNLNNYSDVYRLPADEEELDRLREWHSPLEDPSVKPQMSADKQHLMFIEVMGKYPPPMEEVMRGDDPEQPKQCLDLGCGSGSWIMDVARDFPNCNAVAVDLVPMQSPSMPPNCRSEVDDINLGLEHFYGDFNVVHCRLISSGIRDYRTLIDQISRVVRPGGLVEFVEFDFHAYDHNKRRIEVGTHQFAPPWFPRWLAFACLAARNQGGDVDAATYIHSWVLDNPAFEDVVYRDFWIPASPWMIGDETQMRHGAWMRDDILAFLRSGRPLLLGSGLSETFVNELEHNAARETVSAQLPLFIRLQNVYARKRSS